LVQWLKSAGPPRTRPKSQNGALGLSWTRWAEVQLLGPLRLVLDLQQGHAGHRSASRHAARSRAGESPGGCVAVQPEDQATVWFPLFSHTHQSARDSAARIRGTRSVAVGTMHGSASACACRRAAPSLGAGVHTARPPRRALASRHEGRLGSTRVSVHTTRLRGAATRAKFTGVRRRWVAGMRWSLALGCTRPQPSTHLRSLHKITTAQRPVHRKARRGGQRLTSRRGIKDRIHRRATAAVYRCGMTMALGCARSQPTNLRPLHKNTMARRPTTEAQGTTRARRLARWRIAG
jgi:hypothetical protein